ncbi:hypothetical protein B5C26_10320 [Photorhabdus luminescens]|uniref:hypothetical protein n=1 Tax=Photorhabdus luminescens TaxID=29488 RepID=UPI000B4DD55C|nr:hypothetical protein [Photorhabdus luminescens]OWO82005.1 hypothetical protein B5C26_10320 [Photorhabdus luminescens]
MDIPRGNIHTSLFNLSLKQTMLAGAGFIPVIFQVASLLAALTHPGHIVPYAPGDSLPCRRDAS